MWWLIFEADAIVVNEISFVVDCVIAEFLLLPSIGR